MTRPLEEWQMKAREALAAAKRPTRVAIHLAAADMGLDAEHVAYEVLIDDNHALLGKFAGQAASFIAAFDALIAEQADDPAPVDWEAREQAAHDCTMAAMKLRAELVTAAALRSDTKARDRVNGAVNALESAASLLRDRS